MKEMEDCFQILLKVNFTFFVLINIPKKKQCPNNCDSFIFYTDMTYFLHCLFYQIQTIILINFFL